jgi:hypothetical protein
MEALLPNPAPIGIVDRRVYWHALNSLEPRDRKMYKKAAAAL